MPNRIMHAILAASVLLFSGCAHIDIPLLQPTEEVKERTIEGKGDAKLLILDIDGFISAKSNSGALKDTPSLVAEIRESLQKAEKDPDVAGVILKINSPGGTVTASDIIRHELMNFKERKKVPVYACITGIGASGAYYIATAADEISSHPTAITGSIGVMIMRFNVEGLMSKIGVSETTFKSSDKKDIMSPFRPATREEEKIVQNVINSLYERFVEMVHSRPGSHLTKQEVERLADGRIFTAGEALKDKLIDRIGYLDDAIAAMKTRLTLKEARVITYYRPGNYRGSIYSSSTIGIPQMVNLININVDGLGLLPNSEFMYLWQP